MKRPVTLLLVAALLASGAAFAKNDKDRFVEKATAKAAHTEQAQRQMNYDRRGGDRDHRNDNRNDHRRDHGNDNRHDNNRRDWNDHRRDNDRHDDHRRDGNDHRRDNDRHDNDRRDWNDHRRDNYRHDNDRHDWNRNNYRGWDRHRSDWSNHPHYWDNRRHDRRDYARYRYHYGRYYAPHGYYYRAWHRGDRLPRHWYGSSYVIYDWHPYRLYAPPYGYHWVRVGNDVVLTAIATGIVLDVIYNIWY
jgi:Ni/Co efflux regulator RcnB